MKTHVNYFFFVVSFLLVVIPPFVTLMLQSTLANPKGTVYPWTNVLHIASALCNGTSHWSPIAGGELCTLVGEPLALNMMLQPWPSQIPTKTCYAPSLSYPCQRHTLFFYFFCTAQGCNVCGLKSFVLCVFGVGLLVIPTPPPKDLFGLPGCSSLWQSRLGSPLNIGSRGWCSGVLRTRTRSAAIDNSEDLGGPAAVVVQLQRCFGFFSHNTLSTGQRKQSSLRREKIRSKVFGWIWKWLSQIGSGNRFLLVGHWFNSLPIFLWFGTVFGGKI